MPVSEDPARPEPEALLEAAEREGRGRLKVYLGMAPGVGKTYAMLESARRHVAQGVDLLVGVVETHGRRETEVLLEGLEVLPRRRVEYRGQNLSEFDIDAALARRPQLLLVDELAHTNAPDSRHPKRWQDVEEILEAGIDVHATLNIQHLETLNDIVARITGVRVQETIPDRVLEIADEIELVDLTPQDLLTRLDQGKVYVAELVGRARENFFTPANLTALRELALRRTAERVDADMVGYMRRQAITGPWPAGERILVCVGGDGAGPSVVRAGRRLADQLKAPWVVLHVEAAGRPRSEAYEANVQEAIALAERLEARTERLSAEDRVGAILHYARRNNITQVVLGNPRSGILADLFARSVPHELLRRGGGVAVHLVPLPGDDVKRPTRRSLRNVKTSRVVEAALTATGAVAAVTALAVAVPGLGSIANVSMLYLSAVLLSAVRHGLGAGVASAVAAFLASNFFFTEPRYTLNVSHWHDFVALVLFLVVAITTGLLAGRIRDQVRGAESRMTALQTLYDFSRRLGATRTADALLHAVVLQAHRLSGRAAMVLLPQEEDIAIRYAWPPEDRLDTAPWAAARWAFEHGEPAGADTGTLPSSAWHFRPMRAADRVNGVFGILRGGAPLPPEFLRTLDAMLDQAAVAIERILFARDASRAEAMAETERFRNALLSSVSHDLRTPLTAILGSVTALRSNPSFYDDRARDELLATIQEESERLDRFVNNLLDITRLESGALVANREWLSVGEVIDAVCERVGQKVGGLALVRRLQPALPMVRADFVLLETVLFNLFDNAAKHATHASSVEVAAEADASELRVRVTDDGDGIAPEHLPRVFDKFYRIHRADYTSAGTGLGLSICKGLVEAMGGTIEAESPVAGGRGTRFTLRFPVESQPAAIAEDGPGAAA